MASQVLLLLPRRPGIPDSVGAAATSGSCPHFAGGPGTGQGGDAGDGAQGEGAALDQELQEQHCTRDSGPDAGGGERSEAKGSGTQGIDEGVSG